MILDIRLPILDLKKEAIPLPNP